MDAASSVPRLDGALAYKVKEELNQTGGEKCNYIQREVNQSWVNPEGNGHLINHNNSLMHYADDWYVIGVGADNSWVLVYYCGCNDAWCGYGGAVLYTQSRTLPQAAVPQITKAIDAAKVPGLTYDSLCKPVNDFASCK
jgi:violaxanthin de-epoxidase